MATDTATNPASVYAVRPLSADISIRDMYRYSKLPNTDYGIEGYETPVLHFDHLRKIQADKDWECNTFGKKRKGKPVDMTVKKHGGLNKEIELRAKNTPGPWAYEIKQEWIHGERKKLAEEVATKPRQELKFRWKGIAKDDREFEKQKKIAPKPIDLSVGSVNTRSRNTAILTISLLPTPKKTIRCPALERIFTTKKRSKRWSMRKTRNCYCILKRRRVPNQR